MTKAGSKADRKTRPTEALPRRSAMSFQDIRPKAFPSTITPKTKLYKSALKTGILSSIAEETKTTRKETL